MNHRAFIFRGALSLLLLCGNSVADFTAYTAALVKDLGSTNAQARIRARQLLPRHGAEAIEPLLPLLSSEDQGARLSAYNVIADIANVAASPGHEADRVLATTQLMKLVAADATESQKLQGMRLLTIVVPDGFDVSPIAALLKSDNANMREKARESLTLIATNEACDALISAAGNADAAFAAALLDSVAMLRNPIALDRAAALAEHNDPLVRCAAMRAIAWRGNPEYLQIADSVIARATPETLFFANDAKLRLADAMALHGGNWDAAMQVYKDVLAGATDPEIRGAAMMGLGRHGDATVVDEIVAAAASANGALDSQAAMALTSLRGREGIVAVAEAYPSLSESTRIAILSVWGQDKQEDAIDLVIREVTNTSPAIRFAALQALAAAGSMKGFPALVAVAKDGNAEEKAFALQTVRQMAGRLGGSGDAQAAGLAYVQLYGLSEDEGLRADALRGIAQHPVPQAFDVVKGALAIQNLKPLAVEALAATAVALSANKETEKAIEAAKLVQSSGASVETLVRVASTLGDNVPPELANLLGAVKKWMVIGPFDWKNDAGWSTAFVGEPNVDITKTIPRGDTLLAWKAASGNGPTALVDLTGALGAAERSFGYAYAIVDMAEAGEGQIRLGSDDGNQIWLNGKQVFENRVDRGTALDQDKIDVTFLKGRNVILAKISQGAGGWNFCLRLCRADGTGLPFTQE